MIRSSLCSGCGACAGGRPVELNAHGHLVPTGQWTRSPDQRLERICPFSPTARNEDELAASLFPDAPHRGLIGRFLKSYVGHALEPGVRDRGSSGEMVSWTLAELLRKEVVDAVAHVVPTDEDRLFQYRLSRTEQEVAEGAKSRYYPVEMSRILEQVRAEPGRYAVVGVPCFIKAIQLLRQEESLLQERIVVTLGLFCGHMKSARMLESFAWQMGTEIENVRRPEARIKDVSRPASTYTAEMELRTGEVRRRDWSHMPDGDWGAGFFMNPACDWCDDVVAETADISFGDAWVEPYASDGRGTNVVVVRSPLLAALISRGIEEGRLSLEEVDAGFIERTQAAGFRHRHEGLAYRLTWPKWGVRPLKRVAPSRDLPRDRKIIYLMRRIVSRGSNRVFYIARRLHQPRLYLTWARVALAWYWGVAYSRGCIGRWMQRFLR